MISVLVVDDEPAFLDVAERFLTKDGDIRVLKAGSVKAAFEWMKRENVDVIIADYEMPEQNGIEFLIELRKTGSTVPFMILTGKGWVRVATKAMDFGVDHYLRKGEDPNELFEHIRRKIRGMVKERIRQMQYDEQFRRFRNFFETIPLAGLILNESGTVIDANMPACTLLGYTREEIRGLKQSTLFLTDDSGKMVVSERFTNIPLVYAGQQLPVVRMISLLKKGGSQLMAEMISLVHVPGENQINLLFREPVGA